MRGMVCARCVLVTERLARETGVPVLGVDYGRVHFARALTDAETGAFDAALAGVGFGLIRERDEVLAEALEVGLVKLSERTPAPGRTDLSGVLAHVIDVPYDWAAAAFLRSRDETPAHRYAELLMARAARLLREGELQSTEIAHAVGYAHLSGFSRAFKRYWGVSPTEWGGKA